MRYRSIGGLSSPLYRVDDVIDGVAELWKTTCFMNTMSGCSNGANTQYRLVA